LGLIDRYILKLPVPNWEKEIALTKLAIEKANAMQPKPRFFIICGDLVDAYPGEYFTVISLILYNLI
jgi:serine/threonine-protein phosphatase CPPED1